ncbi:hypothetical protein L7F22_044964, partial [Adiantum nelumboides]|nr:hypothetical protein [Adiantum nelumboides]
PEGSWTGRGRGANCCCCCSLSLSSLHARSREDLQQREGCAWAQGGRAGRETRSRLCLVVGGSSAEERGKGVLGPEDDAQGERQGALWRGEGWRLFSLSLFSLSLSLSLSLCVCSHWPVRLLLQGLDGWTRQQLKVLQGFKEEDQGREGLREGKHYASPAHGTEGEIDDVRMSELKKRVDRKSFPLLAAAEPKRVSISSSCPLTVSVGLIWLQSIKSTLSLSLSLSLSLFPLTCARPATADGEAICEVKSLGEGSSSERPFASAVD